ncbi:MAG TPA: Asp-tRNA(Asn)/Glu-tRNA(Gln) amidotransferase GatCAB subunit A [Elusimicrobia bacterium]|nr:Asp-tRNA(Asn)/Glu-tRNA(Gln) amidotransferase GatCAB subunit A [Elusimicrobiota bacterium]HBT62087.1 Asp-tRNA(Asn)/Glu-tRNA(Gln) amidotransferase GatCAB subunit A [Elusimicrobiota bacterium]
MSTLSLSAASIARDVSRGRVSAEEILRCHMERIRSWEPKVKAFVRVFEDEALAMARAVDAKRGRGERLGRLAGVPIAVKDNIQVRGQETTCASRILRGYVAPFDATAVARLKAEDAVLLGKTNLDEFAMGSSTENSALGPTLNPWDLSRVPGGSSGGSAAAVCCGECALALGSDTGGSIRQPAAFCGVVGLKPSYGRVSRYGLVAYASSLDQIGPLCRTVDDAALALDVMAGPDPYDSTCAAACEQPRSREAGVKGLRVGLPKEYFLPGLDAEVEAAVRGAVEALRGLGAQVSEISLPHTRFAVSSYYILAPCEASSNLARFDGIRYGRRSSEARSLEDVYELSRGEGFGPEVKRRIMLGTYALSSGYYQAYYGQAQRVRTLIRRDFVEAFERVDVIAAPTAPTAAFRLGEKTSDPVAMYLSDVFTIPSNMAGNASISLPCGLTRAGLPIGLQLIAAAFDESTLLRAAAALEQVRPFRLWEDNGHA